MATSAPEVTGDICAHAMNQAQHEQTKLEAQICQDIHSTFDAANRKVWGGIPEGMRVKITLGCSTPAMGTKSRQACTHCTSEDSRPSVTDTSDHQAAQSGVTKHDHHWKKLDCKSQQSNCNRVQRPNNCAAKLVMHTQVVPKLAESEARPWDASTQTSTHGHPPATQTN